MAHSFTNMCVRLNMYDCCQDQYTHLNTLCILSHTRWEGRAGTPSFGFRIFRKHNDVILDIRLLLKISYEDYNKNNNLIQKALDLKDVYIYSISVVDPHQLLLYKKILSLILIYAVCEFIPIYANCNIELSVLLNIHCERR